MRVKQEINKLSRLKKLNLLHSKLMSKCTVLKKTLFSYSNLEDSEKYLALCIYHEFTFVSSFILQPSSDVYVKILAGDEVVQVNGQIVVSVYISYYVNSII